MKMDPETISLRLRGFDTWDDQDILDAVWQGQAGAVAAVRAVLPALASAACDIANRLEVGGRLIFIGAGTSGQIAALEASEIPATYGWPQDRVSCRTPSFRAPEQGVAEDNADYATRLMEELSISTLDAVVALAASGDTAFTCAAAGSAFTGGALVVTLFNREKCLLSEKAHHPIFLGSGSEIPAGSTRMNAGTSQKAALNLISTLVMTRLGRIHDGLMVELTPDRPKFRKRATRIVAAIAECSPTDAEDVLVQAGGDIKQAILMARGQSRGEAAQLLTRSGRNLRKALHSIDQPINAGTRLHDPK